MSSDLPSGVLEHFQPDGLKCPGCSSSTKQAGQCRVTARSQLTTYRCQICDALYNQYTGPVFRRRHLTPQQAVLLMRGICKADSTKMMMAIVPGGESTSTL